MCQRSFSGLYLVVTRRSVHRTSPQGRYAWSSVNDSEITRSKAGTNAAFFLGWINMSLIVKRPVVLKNIVTEEFKKRLREDLSNAIKQINIRIDQMNFQEKRVITDDKQHSKKEIGVMQERLRQERVRQERVKNDLQRRLNEIPSLEIGSEFISGNYEAPVKIEIGDDIRQKLSQAEIIVKDGIVVETKE